MNCDHASNRLLHREGDRAGLRDGAGSTRDDDGVCARCGAIIFPASTATSIATTAATKQASSDTEEQDQHSKDVPPIAPPGSDTNEQDASKSRAGRQRVEEISASIESRGSRRGVHSECRCLA